MYTITLVAQKGGTGKTTLAINLAVAAEAVGHRAVLIDLDPQASAAGWGDHRTLARPVVAPVPATRLEDALGTARAHRADLAIIDTAPHSESSALEAARAADLSLIPLRPGILDLRALRTTADIWLAGTPTRCGRVESSAAARTPTRPSCCRDRGEQLGRGTPLGGRTRCVRAFLDDRSRRRGTRAGRQGSCRDSQAPHLGLGAARPINNKNGETMPSKTKNPLAEAMRELKADPAPAAHPAVRTTPAGKAKPRRGEGTRIIAGHFDGAVHQQLRVLAAQERNTVQGLLQEALNDLFQKRNLPPIA